MNISDRNIAYSAQINIMKGETVKSWMNSSRTDWIALNVINEAGEFVHKKIEITPGFFTVKVPEEFSSNSPFMDEYARGSGTPRLTREGTFHLTAEAIGTRLMRHTQFTSKINIFMDWARNGEILRKPTMRSYLLHTQYPHVDFPAELEKEKKSVKDYFEHDQWTAKEEVEEYLEEEYQRSLTRLSNEPPTGTPGGSPEDIIEAFRCLWNHPNAMDYTPAEGENIL